jgi:hypothetical protein
MKKYVKPMARDLRSVIPLAKGVCNPLGSLANLMLTGEDCGNGGLASGSVCWGDGASVSLACQTGLIPLMNCTTGGTDNQ